jgi:hypothetical protein
MDWLFVNAKFDVHMLAQLGIHLAGRLVDTSVMHALLYEEKPHGLDFMGKELLGWQWKDLLEPWKHGGLKKSYPNVGDYLQHVFATDRTKLIEYASNDAFGTLKIYEKLKEELKAAWTFSLYDQLYPDMWELFDKTEVPFTKVLWECEREGILLNTEQLGRTSASMQLTLEQIEREIIQHVGKVVNPKSTPQMAEYFFGQLKLRPLGMTDGGKSGVRRPQVDDAFLEQHAADVPVAKLLREHRELAKSKGTYADGLSKLVDNYGRLHTKFNQDIARCLPKGELVLTSRGYLPVEEVRIGDTVLTHRGRLRTVVETSKHAPQPIYRIQLEDGRELRTTGNHEYHTQEASEWVRADRLWIGARVTVYGRIPSAGWTPPHWECGELRASSPVRSIVVEPAEVTYGLTVEEDHSHVTGGIVTHNTGRISSSGPNLQNCLHPATELLTRSGWVRIDQLQRGVEVAQWSPDGAVSWAVPLAYPQRHYEGDLVELTGRVRALVTLDHRMVIQAGTPHWRECLAGKLAKCAVPTAGTLAGGESVNPAMLRFAVATQADGSIRLRRNRYELRFGFKKQRKVERLASVLRELGLENDFSCNTSAKGVTTFRGYVPSWLGRWLTNEKLFEVPALLSLSLASRRVFLEELPHWDGGTHSKGVIKEYYTTARQNAEAVLTIAAVSGVKVSFGDNPTSDGAGRRYNVSFLSGSPRFNLSPERIRRVPYSGQVYCVTVPSDHILTRLDGRILVTKNCPNPEADKHGIREAFVPKPGHVLIAADYNALEMRLLAAAARAEDMIALFLSGKDIHMGNASLVYGVPYDDIKAAKKRAGAIEAAGIEGRDIAPLTEYEEKCLEYRRKIKIVGFGQRKFRPKRNSLKTANPKGPCAYGNAVLPLEQGSVSTWAGRTALNEAPQGG